MSDLDKLTSLLLQQAEQSARREERMVAMMERLTNTGGEGGANTGGGQLDATHPPVKLPATAMPAPHLTSSASLRDFATWKSKFEGFMLLTHGNDLPMEEQRAMLMGLLDEDWTRVIRYSLTVAEDIPIPDVIKAMEAHLRSQRNILVDRREFYSRVQEEGETFDDFFCALKEVSTFCDLCSECYDTQIRDRIVCGARDEEAVKCMLEKKDLTLSEAVDICRASEVARATRAEIRGEAVARVSAYNQQRSASRRRIAAQPTNQRCPQCGYSRHNNT